MRKELLTSSTDITLAIFKIPKTFSKYPKHTHNITLSLTIDPNSRDVVFCDA